MTPAELALAIEAENEREKTEWRRLAWFTSILLMPWNKGRQIDPEKLLPGFITGRKVYMTREEARKELDDLKKGLNIE